MVGSRFIATKNIYEFVRSKSKNDSHSEDEGGSVDENLGVEDRHDEMCVCFRAVSTTVSVFLRAETWIAFCLLTFTVGRFCNFG